MKQINDRLIELISHLELSKNQFAMEIGTSSAMISKITKNKVNFGIDLLEKIIGRYPHLNQQWLVTGVGEMWQDTHTYNPHLDPHSEHDSVISDGENLSKDGRGKSRQEKVVEKGLELNAALGDSTHPLFTGYFEENKLAFYLRHPDQRLDGLLSVAITNLKDIYATLKKLTEFIHGVGAPDFIKENFPLLDDFDEYKLDIDKEFSEMYENIKDPKVLKCSLIMHYETDVEDFERELIQAVDYADRYKSFFEGHKDFKGQ